MPGEGGYGPVPGRVGGSINNASHRRYCLYGSMNVDEKYTLQPKPLVNCSNEVRWFASKVPAL